MKSPEKMTVEELRPYHAEFMRRARTGQKGAPKMLRPCPKCGQKFGARELRKHMPQCAGK